MHERDGSSIGRSAGMLLGDALIQLIAFTRGEAQRPLSPIGASRVGGELRRVVFHEGFAAAGAWLQTPGIVEAFILYLPEDADEIRILVPSEEALSFDIVWALRFAVDAQEIQTSEPVFTVTPGKDELLDDFNDGLAAGLELHPRTAELRSGFGALGPFEQDE